MIELKKSPGANSVKLKEGYYERILRVNSTITLVKTLVKFLVELHRIGSSLWTWQVSKSRIAISAPWPGLVDHLSTVDIACS